MKIHVAGDVADLSGTGYVISGDRTIDLGGRRWEKGNSGVSSGSPVMSVGAFCGKSAKKRERSLWGRRGVWNWGEVVRGCKIGDGWGWERGLNYFKGVAGVKTGARVRTVGGGG